MILADSDSTIDITKMEFIPECDSKFPVACYEYSLKNRIEPWHWHNEFEAAIVEKGSARFFLEEKEYQLCSGEGYFVNSAALHSLLDGCGEDCFIRCIVFKGELAEGRENTIFTEKYTRPLLNRDDFQGCKLSYKTEWNKKMLDYVEKLFFLCRDTEEDYEIDVRSILTKMLSLAANNIPNKIKYKEKKIGGETSKIKLMLLYIWNNFTKPIELSEIAKSGMVSKNECLLCFKNTVGISPIQYLKNFRLEKTAEYLRTTNKSVSEISEICGFQDKSYFSKSFLKKYGMTPSKYRKKQRTPIVIIS